MKEYLKLKSLVFNQAHLCTPDYAETVLSVLEDRIGIEEGAYESKEEAKERREANMLGSTYVMPILGSMTHRAGFLDAMSGIQSYQSIKSDIEAAMADPKVKDIVIEMDSPGGTVAGAFDLRDYIIEAKNTKPIYAHANDSMASAAYLIGSACTKVYASQTAGVGSIGVVAMHVDQSEADKQKGIKPTFIHAGAYKTAGNPHEPLEGEAKDYLQKSVDDSYEMFVNAVAESRGLDAADIRATEARVYKGKEAMKLGLVDDVISLDSLLQQLASDSQPRVFSQMSKGERMDKMEKLEADFAQVSAENERFKAALIENGFVIKADRIEMKQEAEFIEISGETVNKADIPAVVLAELESAANERVDAALTATATEMFPNLALDVAKEFASLDLSEAALETLKGADAMVGSNMEETGESVSEDMLSAKEKLDAAIESHMEEHGVSKIKAQAELQKTAEGRALIIEAQKG